MAPVLWIVLSFMLALSGVARANVPPGPDPEAACVPKKEGDACQSAAGAGLCAPATCQRALPQPSSYPCLRCAPSPSGCQIGHPGAAALASTGLATSAMGAGLLALLCLLGQRALRPRRRRA